MRSLIIILWYVVSVCQLVLASPVAPGAEIMPNKREVQQRDGEDEICVTPGCFDASFELIKNIDFTVDPCVSFYRYACRNWIYSHVIPESRNTVSPFTMNNDDLQNNLRNLMEREPQIGETPIIEKMRNVYEGCMDIDKIESIGHEPLLDVIRKLGGWPVLGESSGWTRERQKTFDWLDLLVKFRQLGLNYNVLISTGVLPDYNNNIRNMIYLDQAALGLDPYRNNLFQGLNNELVAAYYDMMVESAVILGASRQDAEEQFLVALNFETALAHYSAQQVSSQNTSSIYKKMNLDQLSSIAPNIDWNKYLTSVLEQPLEADDEIAVAASDYIGKLDKLLVEADSKILANYMMWRVVRDSLGLLSKRWSELQQPMNTILGLQHEAPRWEKCLNLITGTMSIAISSMYVKNYFDPDSKQLASEMVDYIKREFMANLDRIDWMDEQTRREAREKADAMVAHVGYQKELLNDTLIEEHYAGLELKRGEYFNNILNIRKWSTDKSLKQLRKPNSRLDWWKHARAANAIAFHRAIDNSIDIPAAALQGIFFNKTRPNYLNFGAIGFVIGHEMTHGFDDKGRQFDKDGNSRNWWDAETELRFKQRVQCIVDQYNNYVVPKIRTNINGIQTKNENIADNGGIKTAFRAYERWVSHNGVEPKLPGLNLNQRQLFFVSAASNWCSKYRLEVLDTLAQFGPHSPDQFRVIGPMSNMEEFSQAFNCPVGAPMNPAKKCSVW